MTRDDTRLDQIAGAIVEGQRIDWPSAQSSAADESTRQIIHELAVIAAISEVHGSVPLRGEPHATTTLTGSLPETLPTWGSFRLLEKVGEGAYGEVYRAWDTRLDREVALKLLPTGPTDGAAGAAPLIDEGRLLARVRHPNVVTIYGAERIGNRVGLCMEFVKGHTLEQVLEQSTVLSETEALTIGLELCRAVSAVHGAGLVHRDIKTHNVMRSDDGRIALMDFGAGRILEDGAWSDLAGTPLYLAPEVLQGQQATARSDLYSLGVLLYHLVTGSYPVRGWTVGEIRRAHERGERIAVQAARRDLLPKLARVIERATDPCPERRYESADAFGADLAAVKPRSGIVRRQKEISRAIIKKPGPTPGGEPQRRESSLDAHHLCLRGRALVDRRGMANAQQAAELFERAIALDPGFAPAHAGLASAYAFWSFPYRGIPFETAYPIMRPAAVKALQLDPTLAEAHAATGWVYSYEHDWANASKAFQQAISLNPCLTQTYTSYSISTLQPLRKYEEALHLLQVALRHDPLSLDVQREIGEVQLLSGRYAEAIVTLRRVSEAEPDFPFVQTYLARALIFTGSVVEALPRLEQAFPWLAQAYVMTGRRTEAEKLADEWKDYPFRLAIIAAILGDTGRAVDALERAAVGEPHRMGWLLVQPELAALRSHPRVVALRKAFSLP